MELENLKSIETARGKMDVRNVNGEHSDCVWLV